MATVSRESAPDVIDYGPAEDRGTQLDGYAVVFTSSREDWDLAPLLKHPATVIVVLNNSQFGWIKHAAAEMGHVADVGFRDIDFAAAARYWSSCCLSGVCSLSFAVRSTILSIIVS